MVLAIEIDVDRQGIGGLVVSIDKHSGLLRWCSQSGGKGLTEGVDVDASGGCLRCRRLREKGKSQSAEEGWRDSQSQKPQH
jgi:hypothetical protein